MGRPLGSRNKTHKQFCVHGHDTFICGRNKKGMCIQCDKERIRPLNKQSLTYKRMLLKRKKKRDLFRLEHPIVKKQFCKYGHDISIVGRTKHGVCVECFRIKNRKDPTKDSRKIQFCSKGHDKDIVGRYKDGHCKKCHDEHSARYQIEHQEELLIKQKKYWEEHKEEIKARIKKWSEEHPGVIQASKIKCKTNRNLRIPLWVDWNKIIDVYKNKPSNMTVDHYIPLQGDFVSGLNVSWNLQYLTKSQNSSKHNKCNLLEASEWYGKILEKEGLK